jgi:hypothetical protein
MSLMRHVFLGVAVIWAAGFASAQAPVPPQSDSTSISLTQASSSTFQLATSGDSDALIVLPPAPIAESIGTRYHGGGKDVFFSRTENYIGDHIAIDLGAGFNAPIGNDIPYITWGGNFTLGGGLHLSKRFTVLAEYQFMDNKLPGALIAEAGTQGGHAHIWSLTLNPVIDLFPARANSVYVTGGGGFYRKLTSFTEPGEYGNVVVGHFSSNQGGISFGLGLTHRPRWIQNMQVFAEVRYLFLNTPSITQNNGLGTTELLPVTIGVRW